MKILVFPERLSVHKARTAVAALERPLLHIGINSDMKSALDRPPVQKERNLFVTNTQARATVYIPYQVLYEPNFGKSFTFNFIQVPYEPNFGKSFTFNFRDTRINK
jgi:hypothetical protein